MAAYHPGSGLPTLHQRPSSRAGGARLRLPFAQVRPEVDETPRPGEAPASLALRLAEAKALAIAATRPEAVVIGSDQVASIEGRTLGKPGAHHPHVELARQVYIGGEAARTAQQGRIFEPSYAGADSTHLPRPFAASRTAFRMFW